MSSNVIHIKQANLLTFSNTLSCSPCGSLLSITWQESLTGSALCCQSEVNDQLPTSILGFLLLKTWKVPAAFVAPHMVKRSVGAQPGILIPIKPEDSPPRDPISGDKSCNVVQRVSVHLWCAALTSIWSLTNWNYSSGSSRQRKRSMNCEAFWCLNYEHTHGNKSNKKANHKIEKSNICRYSGD